MNTHHPAVGWCCMQASRRQQPLFLAARLGEAGLAVSLPPSVQRQQQQPEQQLERKSVASPTADGSSGSEQPDEALKPAGAPANNRAQQGSDRGTAATAGLVEPPIGLEQEGAAAPDSTSSTLPAGSMPTVPAASTPEEAQAAEASVEELTGEEGRGQGQPDQGQGPTSCQDSGKDNGDGGSEAERGEQGSDTGVSGAKGAIQERAGRLAMLQYKSGKLSRTQLLTRHGKAVPALKSDPPEGRSS